MCRWRYALHSRGHINVSAARCVKWRSIASLTVDGVFKIFHLLNGLFYDV